MKSRSSRPTYLIVALAGLALILALDADPVSWAQVESDPLVEEVAGVNRSLVQLVTMLERSMAHQEIDLVLKRIELHERRLAPLEREMRSSEGDLFDAKSEVTQLREMLKSHEDQIREFERAGAEQDAEASRQMIAELERVIQMELGRMETMQRRVQTLQDDLADGRDEIAILDDLLHDLLD